MTCGDLRRFSTVAFAFCHQPRTTPAKGGPGGGMASFVIFACISLIHRIHWLYRTVKCPKITFFVQKVHFLVACGALQTCPLDTLPTPAGGTIILCPRSRN